MRFSLPSVLLLILLGLTALPVQAHKVSVFAYVEEGIVKGETAFSGGKEVKNGNISVLNAASGSELLSLQTDSQGLFAFPVPEEAQAAGFDLKIVLVAGEAHRGEWVLTAADYQNVEGTVESATPAADTGVQLFDILAGLALILGGGAVIALIRSKRKEA